VLRKELKMLSITNPLTKKTSNGKLTRYELDNLFYPEGDDIVYEGDKKLYAIAFITPTRKQWVMGRRKRYIVLEVDKQNEKYRILRRTNDFGKAQFSLNNCITFEVMSKQFHAFRKKKASRRAVMDRTVRRNSAKNDPILRVIWSMDLRPGDRDNEATWYAKRNLASIRPRDLQVIVYPQKQMLAS